METTPASVTPEGIPLSPETNPVAIYAFVVGLDFKDDYDHRRAARILPARGRRWERRAVRCGEEWLALRAGRAQHDGFFEYEAVAGDGQKVAKVVISGAFGGVTVPEHVEAEPGREAVVAEMFREIHKDALRQGARLRPCPPGLIGELELRAWWEVDRMAVAFYEESQRLGLTLDGEDAKDLEYLRHLIPAVRIEKEREGIKAERGTAGLAYIEEVGARLAEARGDGCRNAGDMARWLTERGVKARSRKGWTEHSVRDVARLYERATGVKVLRWGRGRGSS